MVKVEKRCKRFESKANSQIMCCGILYLVDLAGSERVKKSRSTGDRLHEAKSINSSLSALGKCIAALSDTKIVGHVPFRDSKLTRLLQDSLGGNCKTALIVTIGPSYKHIDETISTLSFGNRAMNVQNKPAINKQKDFYVLTRARDHHARIIFITRLIIITLAIFLSSRLIIITLLPPFAPHNHHAIVPLRAPYSSRYCLSSRLLFIPPLSPESILA